MAGTLRASIAVACQNRHGEGVLWSHEHGLVMWTDIEGRAFWTYDPLADRARSVEVPERLCCFAPRRGRPWHDILAGFASGFAFFDLVSGDRRDIAAFEPRRPTTRLNDGRTDPRGRFVAGGMDEASPGAAISSVVLLDTDLSVRPLIGGVACANSICFAPDGRAMAFADSPSGIIELFDYDPDLGEVSARRRLARTAGVPDGSCFDSEGYVWNAVWEGYRVERYGPDGRLDQVVEVPVAKPTCCAFGGPDLRTLYITTSCLGSEEDRLAREPQSGHLFAVRPGAAGLPGQPFG